MHVHGTHRHSKQCPGAVAVWGGYVKPSWLQGAREVPWLGNGKMCVGSVWFAAQEGQEYLPYPGWCCACTQAPLVCSGAAALRRTERLGKRLWSFLVMSGLLFVCFFSCLVSREHNLSQTGISWVVVSFSGKPVFLSFPFPLGKSLFQLPFRALPPAVPATPAFAHSILYQRRGKH